MANSIIEKLKNTQIADNSLEKLGTILRSEFDKSKNEDRAFELLQLAYKYQIPQLNGMIDDFYFSDFNLF